MNPVAPYAGQNQSSQIVVPRTISNREQREESCWVMPPYANLFPHGEQGGMAFIPPPVQLTEIFKAQQTWPL